MGDEVNYLNFGVDLSLRNASMGHVYTPPAHKPTSPLALTLSFHGDKPRTPGLAALEEYDNYSRHHPVLEEYTVGAIISLVSILS